ncbi:hypothetical protein BRC2024_HCTLARHO_CDS_0052 [Acinetobacter phage vB_AbaS_Silvergun]
MSRAATTRGGRPDVAGELSSKAHRKAVTMIHFAIASRA